MIIHFVWRSGTGLSEFIEDPLEEFNYLFTAIGAITKLILFEQLSHPLVVIAHTQLEVSEMFNVIFAYIHSLRGAQKVTFDNYKSYACRIGHSQRPSTTVLAPLDILFT